MDGLKGVVINYWLNAKVMIDCLLQVFG